LPTTKFPLNAFQRGKKICRVIADEEGIGQGKKNNNSREVIKEAKEDKT
jgi:hypothetical protein